MPKFLPPIIIILILVVQCYQVYPLCHFLKQRPLSYLQNTSSISGDLPQTLTPFQKINIFMIFITTLGFPYINIFISVILKIIILSLYSHQLTDFSRIQLFIFLHNVIILTRRQHICLIIWYSNFYKRRFISCFINYHRIKYFVPPKIDKMVLNTHVHQWMFINSSLTLCRHFHHSFMFTIIFHQITYYISTLSNWQFILT